MRAALCTRYGPPEVLQVRDVKKPAPKSDQLLVKIHATAVTSSDLFIRSAAPSAPWFFQLALRLAIGIRRPRNPILGLVLAGEVEAIGKAVKRFRIGDRVHAFTYLRFGCYAEYTCLAEESVVGIAPSNLGFEEAAAIPYGALLALHYLKKEEVKAGQRVLIYGASGAVGAAAIQLARHLGAEVTAACSGANLALVESLGAAAVIDYTISDALAERYDLVFDAVGKRKTSKLKEACKEALLPNGKYSSVDQGSPRFSASDLSLLKELVEAGELKPVIDRSYPLEQIAEAHRYVEQGHKKGNVVIALK